MPAPWSDGPVSQWVMERIFAWATRFRRFTEDYEQLPETR
jgi:hypothetical protein